MPDKSLIIIGAGLAGLATGVYAQMNGYRSQIFEHHSQPGGVAAWWRRGSWHIDGGIHFLMGHRPAGALYELYRELGTAAPDTVSDMTEYGAFVDETSGKRARLGADLDRAAAELTALSPADVKPILDLIAGARAFRSAGAFDVGMGNPPELAGPLDMIQQFWGMRKVLKYFGGKYGRTAAEFARDLHDPTLRTVVENLFLPEAPMWFLFMVLGLLADGQMGLLTRGCEGFVRPIEQRYRDLGGAISYQATVEKILVEGGRAVGVRLADGSEHRSDAVVSAADGRSTIFQMLDGRYADEKTRARYRDWKLIKPYAMLSFGVNREFPGEPHFTLFRLHEPIIVGSQRVELLGLRIFNYSPHFAPAGKTVIQPSFEAEWDYWNTLQQQDRAAYEAEKERMVAEILRRLEVHYPGLSAQVEMTDVATPYTTWRYTRNWRGAYEGWLPTGPQIMTALPRTLPGLASFVMAGQWVVPGGGVPTCLMSGRDAVRILCKRDGKEFVAHG
ncbi:MAG: NAD(P)/FAD-dependent oxidoreductase [Chloroflexi bacterium]|nr:NAD(P)/FAD-dependent oxidoreductase [Chloroflexota bacterium]